MTKKEQLALMEIMGPVKVRRTGIGSFCAVLSHGYIVEHGRMTGASAVGSGGPDAIYKLFNELTNLRATQKIAVNATGPGRREYRWNGKAFVPG